MKRLTFFLLALTATVALAGCSALEGYAAKVNGQRLGRDDLDRELEAILANRRYVERIEPGFSANSGGRQVKGVGDDTFSTAFVAAVLNRRISFMLIRQELERRDVAPSAEDRKQAREQAETSVGGAAVFRRFPEAYRSELVGYFADALALQRVLGEPDTSAADVRRFYEQNTELFERTCVRHVLADSAEKAASVKARVGAGEDFAAIARAESTDRDPQTGTAERGGDLGCVPKGQFVPEFEQAMDALQPGQVSDPVQTQFGFHAIQVLSKRTIPLEEATTEIRRRLEAQRPDAVARFVGDAVRKARIEVNPRYGRFVRSGPDIGVQPPARKSGVTTTTAPAGGPVVTSPPAGQAPDR